ncbi:hypothetical protein Tco_0528231 [Tanacetum coccineum]
MLAICNAAEPVVFKSLKPSFNAERVSQGTKPGVKHGHKKHSTSSKQPSVSSKEATEGGSSKAPTGSKTGHLKRKKESSLAMESNPSQTSTSTPVVAEMRKEDQQETGGPTSLGVTSEVRASPQRSSGMSGFNLIEPIYLESFITHSKFASGDDVSIVSTAEADPGKSAPTDFVPQQQSTNEGTKNTSYDHLFADTDPHVLPDKAQSISEGLETVLTQPTIRKGASSIARQVREDEALRTIKLEELAKLVSSVQPSFKDLDSPEDDPIIVLMTVMKMKSLKSTNWNLRITKLKLKLLSLKLSPPFLMWDNELLVKSLQTEFSKILSAHDFSYSLPTDLKDLPSKFNELNEEVKGLKKQVHEL